MNKLDNDQKAKEEEMCKQKNRGKKRKRVASESSTDEDVLPENTLEMEKNLHASAIKNNLDDVSVKKILKKVVTNDHVLALVKLREEEEDSGKEGSLQPKITRAKAKELMKVSPRSAPWNLELTPIKHIPVKTRPEVKALIAQELPEDEDDDEYEPTNDDVPSDDDHMLESSSDMDSLPRTPVTPRSLRKTSPKVVSDGPFKVPQPDVTTTVRKKLYEEEPTIALRTRSKLSLSATSIEHIESSFVPPDDLPMPDVDSLWNNFLNDCLNPASNARHEDDDEADPEYNVAADPDANEEDEESLEKSIIKISKKELNDLVTELFSIIPDNTAEQLADDMVPDVTNDGQLQPKEPLSDASETVPVTSRVAPVATKDERFSIDECEPQQQKDGHTSNIVENLPADSQIEQQQATIKISPATPAVETPAPKQNGTHSTEQPPSLLHKIITSKPKQIRIEIQKDSCEMSNQQRLLLQQQLRQHVQLAASSFLQLFVHPRYWARAPAYKEFLVSLNKIVEKNPSSVVDVCNLQPALELVASWETAMATSSKENIAMVEFIENQLDRHSRRCAQTTMFVGEFPELFMQVVSNSTVFQYPYLLPSTPCSPNQNIKRNKYSQTMDSLIALGLDQFWDYVVANPQIYKPASKNKPRRHWGLSATIQLVCKHVMPWQQPRTLHSHVRKIRRSHDIYNPIYKFFKSRTLEPVKHRLLPFNPKLTLYEQPECEMPRVWLRYLAKTSKRFKAYINNHYKSRDTTPKGVDLDINVETPIQKPLPIDFTKEINCNRLNVLPKKNNETTINRIDVPISTNTTVQPLVANNIFTVVSTSSGTLLIPLQVEPTTFDTTTTSCTPLDKDLDEAEGTRTAEICNPANLDNVGLLRAQGEERQKKRQKTNEEHCSCCILLRKICKSTNDSLLEHSQDSSENEPIKCLCKGRRYPRITNRLKLLINNYGPKTMFLYNTLRSKILTFKEKDKKGKSENDSTTETSSSDLVISDDNERDLEIATRFQLKLTTDTVVARNNFTKKRIHTLFSKFNVFSDDVLGLTKQLFTLCGVDLINLYKEFIGFLTAEQADQVDEFHNYLIHRCTEDLIQKIEELVPDQQSQYTIFMYLKSKLFTTAFSTLTACEMCTSMLEMTEDYPALAQYVFSLFPHKHSQSEQQHDSADLAASTNNVEPPTDNIQTHAAVESEVDNTAPVDYEDNNTANDHDDKNVDIDHSTLHAETQSVDEDSNTPLKVEEEEIDVVNISKAESDCDSFDIVKIENPEWKRDEDKIILQILKQHIAPEEREDKSILEILEETQVFTLISEGLPHKPMNEVKERMLYLLRLLLVGDY